MINLKNIYQAKFIDRLNRFVWLGELSSWEKIKFHIWDTWRLGELLKNWNDILVQALWDSRDRRYNFRLIAAKNLVWDWILVNSLLHSQLVELYLKEKWLKYKKEVNIWDSRIDFLICQSWINNFVEVKWCSLMIAKEKLLKEGIKEKDLIRVGPSFSWYENYIWMFPDAPTQRWIKHLQHLIYLKQSNNNVKVSLRFLLLNKVSYFYPNIFTDKKFVNIFFEFLNNWGELKFLYVDVDYIPMTTFAGHITISVHQSL